MKSKMEIIVLFSCPRTSFFPDTGGSRLKLNADILMNISIKSPTLKEQKKIGFMLSLLEENTIFQQRKLNKLELLNQFFLQHMFI